MIVQLVLALICLSWIIIDAVLKDDLFEWSHQFQIDLQDGDTDKSIPKYMFFRVVTLLGEKELIAFFVLVGYVFFANKIQALKLLFGTLLSAYALTMLKMFYHEPRPYFVYSDLQGIGCDLEFGKPSGHTMVTAVLFYLIFDSIVNRKFFIVLNSQSNTMMGKQQATTAQIMDIENPNKSERSEGSGEQSKNNKEEVKIYQERFVNSFIYLPAYLILAFLIGFSRIMLGVHTFGQVLVGWSYATLYILFYRWKLEKFIENVLNTVTYKQFSNKKQLYLITLYITLAYMVSVAIGCITYYLVDKQISEIDRQTYLANILKLPYCKVSEKDMHKFLAGGCLLDCDILSLIYGVLISALSLQGEYKPELWNDNYKKLRIHKKILRILIVGSFCVIPFLATEFYFISNIYLYFFFRSSLRYFFIAIFLIRFAPWLLKKTKLEIDGDYLKCLPNSSFFDNPYTSNDYVMPSQTN